MTEIKDLTEVTALAGNDQLPVYSVANAATRKATVDQVTAYVRDAFGLDVQNLNFGLRSDAVTAIVALQGLLEGQVFTAAGRSYLRRYGATEIADMPGFVPNGDYTPMHWDAVGDGVTDDGAKINLALAAWKVAVNGAASSGGPTFNGLGKQYKSTISLNCTAKTSWRWSMRDFTVISHATGKVALDMVGTRGISLTNVHVYGDATNRPRVGIFRARALAGGSKNFSDTHDWRGVKTGGWFTLAGTVLYGAESDVQTSCRYWNSDEGGQGAIIGGYDYYPVVSEYEAPITGHTSHINVSYIMCEFRQTPFTRSGAITAVSLTNPMTITITSATPFSIGDTVVMGDMAGCPEIYNMKATITNKVGNVLTFGAVDASGFTAWTSGGYIFAYFSRPALTVGRVNGHKFDGCYYVGYGEGHIEVPYGDVIRNLTFTNSCMEGYGNSTSIRFLPGTLNMPVHGFMFDGYQCLTRDSFISTNATGAGKVTMQNSRIAMNSQRYSQNFFDDASKFTCYNVDIVAPNAATIDITTMPVFFGSVHTTSDGVYKKYMPTIVGNVQFEPKSGVSQRLNFEDGAGNNSAYFSYDSGVDAFSMSLDGTNGRFNFVETSLYPATDNATQLGLTNRWWSNVWAAVVTTAQATVGKILYRTGQGYGGTVTQITDKSTAVTLNTQTGQITVNNASLAAGATVVFELNNNKILAASVINAWVKTSSTAYRVGVRSVSTGRAAIEITNTTGGALAQVFVIGFEVLDLATT